MRKFDVAVVGAGHAGIEAALAAARMGMSTACVTLRLDRVGHLPCNCSIGGPGKGHIAREVDALGGQMALTTDRSATHIRRVGTGRGPSVQTLRTQVCKSLYPQLMREVLEAEPNLELIEGEVESLIAAGGEVSGLRVRAGDQVEEISVRAAVLTTGTFLNGLCHEGDKRTVGARHGDVAAKRLADFLIELGVRTRRFKTGTTPRVDFESLDLGETEEMPSDAEPAAMSFLNDRPTPLRELFPCWQTRTNATAHDLIRDSIHLSAMFSGNIEGVGPRNCPSIEDKIVRFAGKDSHPIFLELEEWDSPSVYVQGVSTSLPADVQLELLHTVPGMRRARMLRPGYAVEYDMADPVQLDASLMSKLLPGLFLAGQINGTSGYEEAAGQGIVAGINAARRADGLAPVILRRDESFIGVMVDDLVTKGVDDPYRMLTARAEHRLHLRHDNADARLTPLAREIGLCGEARWSRFSAKRDAIAHGMQELESQSVNVGSTEQLAAQGIGAVSERTTLFELMKRPDVTLDKAEAIAAAADAPIAVDARREVREQIELAALYDGYLKIQRRQVERARRLEEMRVPASFDFDAARGLSKESRQKLSHVRPTTIGQASRIPGVRPVDIALLIGQLRAG